LFIGLSFAKITPSDSTLGTIIKITIQLLRSTFDSS